MASDSKTRLDYDSYPILDLFAGAGGWSVAARSLGLDDSGVENMKEAVLTRKAAGLTTVHDDVWTLEDGAAGFRGHIASPPCQTFSLAGKGAGREALDDVLRLMLGVGRFSLAELRERAQNLGDERTGLVLTPLHYALENLPEWLAWEQVPTVLPVWEAAAVLLEDAGYSVWTGYLHSEQYGVPQTRKRAFLLASRKDGVVVGPPKPTHSRYYSRTPEKLDPGVLPWVSMADALGWGDDTPWDWAVPPKGNDTWPLNRPSPTVVGSFAPDVIAAPGYRKAGDGPRQKQAGSVRITVEQAGILQSFPVDFPFQGSKGKKFLQVGNAVPPRLAEAVIESLVE